MAVANLDSSGVEMRLKGALASFGLALLLAVVLRYFGLSPWTLGVLVVPFFMSAWLSFQGLFRTCTVMAKNGVRDVGDGQERVANPVERAQLALRGRTVMLLAVSTALLATLSMILVARL